VRIETIHGLIDDGLLVLNEIEEDVPCGKCVTKQYFLDGELVRQDIEINVTKEALGEAFSMTGETGKL
jgi:hypothetical protein